MSLHRSAGLIQLSAQAAAFVRLAEFRHIVVQRSEPFLRAQLRHGFFSLPECRGRVAVVGIRKTGKRHTEEHRRVPVIRLHFFVWLPGKKRFMLPKQCRQRSIRLCAHLGIPISEYGASSCCKFRRQIGRPW